jgi:hypothetical protein
LIRYRYPAFTDSSLRFEEGGLWSDLVPSTRIVHSFLNGDNAVVLADERAHHGITDFCARMVCEISSTSNGRRGVVISYIIIYIYLLIARGPAFLGFYVYIITVRYIGTG